eukprot:3229149-Rhodomonas_salina.3
MPVPQTAIAAYAMPVPHKHAPPPKVAELPSPVIAPYASSVLHLHTLAQYRTCHSTTHSLSTARAIAPYASSVLHVPKHHTLAQYRTPRGARGSSVSRYPSTRHHTKTLITAKRSTTAVSTTHNSAPPKKKKKEKKAGTCLTAPCAWALRVTLSSLTRDTSAATWFSFSIAIACQYRTRAQYQTSSSVPDFSIAIACQYQRPGARYRTFRSKRLCQYRTFRSEHLGQYRTFRSQYLIQYRTLRSKCIWRRRPFRATA